MKKLLALMLLCACAKGPGDGQTLRFRYWGDAKELAVLDSILAGFERARPGTRVVRERKPADASYADILTAEFASGRAPDVIFLSTTNIDVLMETGKLADLSRFAAGDPEFDRKAYYPKMMDRFSYGKSFYAVPRDVAPVACVYYNKKLFDRAGLKYPHDGWNWLDLRQAAIKLTKRSPSGTPLQMGFADDRNTCEAWILSAGGKILDDMRHPTRIMLDSPESLRGISFRRSLIQDDKVMPSSADRQDFASGNDALFIAGKLAMFHSGIWKTPTFREIKDFDWDIAMFPKGPSGKRGFFAGGSGYGINADSKNQALCWALVKHLTGKKSLTHMAATGLAQPALMEVANSPAFLDGQKPLNKKMLLQAAEIGTPDPAWSKYREFIAADFLPATDMLWVSGYQGSTEELVKGAVEKANRKYFSRPSSSR